MTTRVVRSKWLLVTRACTGLSVAILNMFRQNDEVEVGPTSDVTSACQQRLHLSNNIQVKSLKKSQGEHGTARADK